MSDLPKRFLHEVWRLQSPHPSYFTFLATKDWDSGAWTDHPIRTIARPLNNYDGDLYFCPNIFNDSRRLRTNAEPGCWLYADLDEVSPFSLADNIQPTLAWETSPGRYQAMWLLDRLLSPRSLEKLNHRLTYFTGADKGGWSLTKVLRVPGTVSTKYGRDNPFRVRMVTSKGPKYKAEDIAALVRDVDTSGYVGVAGTPRPPLADLPDYATLYKRRRGRMPVRARQLLNTKNVLTSDDRSARLWELENLLLDCGIRPEHVLVLVRHSPWNKYRGQRRELNMLWSEIIRAKAQRATPGKKPPIAKLKRKDGVKRTPAKERRQRFTTYHDLMTKSLPRSSWLVEGIWSEGAHGLLGGESKSFKTLITLDLAVSVASGTPFLGRFPVPKQGPVTIIQEENSPADMQDRLMRITASRGVGPALRTNGNGNHEIDFGQRLPINIANNTGFSLVSASDLRELERHVKQARPALIILDPLYLLTPGCNEDSAAEMTPVLKALLRLKQKYDVGIMIVHHYKKRSKDSVHTRAAERMSGTGVFHRWLASGVYVERPDESVPVVRLSSEHRSQASPGAFEVRFDLGTDEDLHYEATVETWIDKKNRTDEEYEDDVVAAILARQDRLVRVTALATELDITPNAMRRRLQRRGIPLQKDKRGITVVARADAEREARSGRPSE